MAYKITLLRVLERTYDLLGDILGPCNLGSSVVPLSISVHTSLQLHSQKLTAASACFLVMY